MALSRRFFRLLPHVRTLRSVQCERQYKEMKTTFTSINGEELLKEIKTGASPETWENIRSEVQKTQNILPIQVDTIILNKCGNLPTLDACIDYMKFLRCNHDVSLGAAKTYLQILQAKYISCPETMSETEEEEIISVYNDLKKKYTYLDCKTAHYCLVSLCLTREWREAEKLLDVIALSNKPSVIDYSAIAYGAFLHGDGDTGWKYLRIIVEKNLEPYKFLYSGYLKYCQEAGAKSSRENIEKMFGFWKDNNITILQRYADEFYTAGKSLGWSGGLTKISNKGVCQHCGNILSKVELSEKEFAMLADSIMEKIIIGDNVYMTSQPGEIKLFLEFLKSIRRYDVVIDGLNVMLFNSPVNSIQLLYNVIDHFTRKGKVVLFIARQHIARNIDIKKLKRKALVFLTENLTFEDSFLLFATLYAGNKGILVTRDFMRQFKVQVADPSLQHLFRKWQLTHQVAFFLSKQTKKLVIREPWEYDPTIQQVNGIWHIPSVSSESSILQYDLQMLTKQWHCMIPPEQTK